MDTGCLPNFQTPERATALIMMGKYQEAAKLFVVGIACLAYGLAQHSELVRCAVAHAGKADGTR